MKKTFMAAAVAATCLLASCDQKPASTGENIDNVEDVITALSNKLTTTDADTVAFSETMEKAMTKIEELNKEGKTEEANAYALKLLQWVEDNKTLINEKLGEDASVASLVTTLFTLNPTEAAEQAGAAASADAESVKNAAKETAETVANEAKAAAEAKANEIKANAEKAANDAVNTATQKASEAVGNAQKKADEAINNARQRNNDAVSDAQKKANDAINNAANKLKF